MQVVCNNCQSKLKLPDDKIPQGRSFALNCPNCKQRISVDAPPASPAAATASATQTSPAAATAAPNMLERVAQDDYNASEKPFDFVEPGAQTALLCDTDPFRADTIRQCLQGKGYHIREPGTVMEALKLMRFHLFDLVVVHTTFDPGDTGNAICHYLAQQPMTVRRNMFVALISSQLRTMDNMAAYNQSVNLVINDNNIADFEAILNRAISDQSDFYRVFKDVLVRSGKG